jgi:septum formation inhibitor-activating ATPase MinD
MSRVITITSGKGGVGKNDVDCKPGHCTGDARAWKVAVVDARHWLA